MFSDNVRWLLLVSSWQTLTGALAHVTTLFVYTQNLGFSLGDASLFMTSMGLALGVYRILVTPVLDYLVSPWVLVLSAAGVAVGRCALVAQLAWFLTARDTGVLVALPPTMMAVAALQTLASTSVSLAMKRAAERENAGAAATDRHRDNADYVRTYGVAYSFDNIGSGLALALFQVTKWTETTTLVANIVLVAYSALAAIGGVALAVHVWPILQANAVEYARLARRSPGALGTKSVAPLASVSSARDLRHMAPIVSVNVLLLLTSVGFLFNDTVLPYVMMSHSPLGAAAPFTLVQLLNMVVVIGLAPLVQIVTAHRVSNYTMLLAGALLGSLANLVPLAADPAALWPYIVYMGLFSVAESVWSARVTAYNLYMSPRGREATYMAAVSIPSLVGTLLLRLGVGYATEHLCPIGADAARCAARDLWGLALAVTASAPLALFFLRNVLDRPPPAQRLD